MLILKGLFTTITNVNFNNVTIKQLTEEIHIERNRINSQKFDDYDMKKLWNDHEDIRSLKSLILFGIKGMAAYAYHAQALGKTDSEVTSFFYKALRAIGPSLDCDCRIACSSGRCSLRSPNFNHSYKFSIVYGGFCHRLHNCCSVNKM